MLKKLAILGIAASLQASAPMPGQTVKAATQGSNQIQEQSNNNHAPAAPASPLVNNQVQPGSSNTHGGDIADKDKENTVTLTGLPPVTVAPITIVDKQKTFWDHIFDWGPWVFTGLLVVVGLLQVGTTIWQALLLRKTRDEIHTQAGHMESQIAQAKAQVALVAEQNKNARDRERAHLVIRYVNDPEIGGPESSLEDRRPLSVRFFVENVGPSKAFNVRAWGIVGVISDPDKALHEDGFLQDFPQIIDEGSETHGLSLAGLGLEFDDFGSTPDFQSITEELATQIWQGKAFIQASGLLTYDDIFDDPHRTPFRFVWKSRGSDDGRKWRDRSRWVDYSPDST